MELLASFFKTFYQIESFRKSESVYIFSQCTVVCCGVGGTTECKDGFKITSYLQEGV